METTPKILGAHFVVGNSIQEERKICFLFVFSEQNLQWKGCSSTFNIENPLWCLFSVGPEGETGRAQ